jgi:hypothetical protein
MVIVRSAAALALNAGAMLGLWGIVWFLWDKRSRAPALLLVGALLLLGIGAAFGGDLDGHYAEQSDVVAVIASVCLEADCHDVVVTTSDQDQRVNMMSCQMLGPAALAEWMGREWPGFTLAGWKCVNADRQRRGA